MKKLAIPMISVLLLGPIIFSVSCNTCEICGRYVNENLPDAFIKIDSNSNCIGYGFMGGRWKVSGDKLLITSIRGPYVYKIRDSKLIDIEGGVWIKENAQ